MDLLQRALKAENNFSMPYKTSAVTSELFFYPLRDIRVKSKNLALKKFCKR